MPGPPFVSGESVDLCPVAEEDLEFLADTVNDPAVWRSLSARRPTTASQERDWYEEHASGEGGDVHFVVARDGEPLGSLGLHGLDDVDGSAEVGILLAEDHWGQGYGTEAARLATSYAFDQHRRHRVVARVFEHNEASARVWEKLGFELEGTHRDEAFADGEYRDVHYYSVLEDEWEG